MAILEFVLKFSYSERTLMRSLIGALVIALSPAFAWAGELFGSVSENGKPLANIKIQFSIAGKVYDSTTDAQGSYRLFADESGKGQFSANVSPSAVSASVFSSNNAVRYDWVIETKDGQKNLRRK